MTVGLTPNATLSAGLERPDALAFDSHGNLFVANSDGNSVSEFAPGATTPSAVLVGGLDNPFALAFDSSGDLFVANYSNTVSEFKSGATTPTVTLTGLDDPAALAFDSSGNLFVANESGGTISVFAPGATTASAVLDPGAGQGGVLSLAFDHDGNLYAGVSGLNRVTGLSTGAYTIDEFAPGGTEPEAELSGIGAPEALAFDSKGDLFVTNFANIAGTVVIDFEPSTAFTTGTTVSEFAPGATTPTATLTGVSSPFSLTFDSHGNLFVGNTSYPDVGTVSEFAPGSLTPNATLNGLENPTALAFDSSGDLFVANNADPGSVSEFAPQPWTLVITGDPGENVTVDVYENSFFVTINGATTTYPTSQVNKIVYDGPVGASSTVVFEDENGPDQVTQSLSSASVIGYGFPSGVGYEFDAKNVQTLYIYAFQSGPPTDDSVELSPGTAGSYYVYSAAGNYSYLADPAAGIYSEVSGVHAESVVGGGASTYAYIYSISGGEFVGGVSESSYNYFPNPSAPYADLVGFGQLYLVGGSATLNTDGGTFIGTPGFSYVSGTSGGSNYLIGALYAASVAVQASNPTDPAFFYSAPGDVFNGSPSQSTLTGSASAFASFQTFSIAALGFQNVTVEESGTGTDVANLTSPGGGVFISSPTVSTLAINGVTVLTVITASSSNGSFQAAPSQVNVTGAGTDTAYLYDGPGSNRLVAAGSNATLTRAVNSASLSQFGLVLAEQTTGTDDTASVQAIDFALRLLGNWTRT